MRLCHERCPDCPSRDLPWGEQKKVVVGVGPRDAKIAFIGEAPGKMENRIGVPFCGPTGEELNKTYLPLAGLKRNEIWIGNTVACHWADSSDAPPAHVVNSCSEFHLRRDLQALNPEVVVLMGGISNSIIDVNVDTVHGTGRYGKIWDWKGKIFSTYHPALGMHMGSAMQALLEDFAKLGKFISGELPVLEDLIPNPSYFDLKTAGEVDVVMGGRYDTSIAVDTESRKTWKGTKATVKYIGWCATFCIDPGTAYMVKVENKAAWARFLYHLAKFKKIIMQNAPHDFRVLLDCGLSLDWDRIVDTMDMAYVCGNIPKGLKPMSYQLLGVTARSFDDVVRPYGLAAVMDYFQRASEIEWPKPEQEPTGEMETKKCQECGGLSVISWFDYVECEECCGKGTVAGKKKLKKCPTCKGSTIVRKKNFKPCTCDGGYVVVPKMTRKQGLNQKINRLITDYINNGNSDTFDPWDRFENWEDATRPIVEAMGYPPLPSVEQVPAHEIEDYACLDSHSTKRAEPELEKRMAEIRERFDYEQEAERNQGTTA